MESSRYVLDVRNPDQSVTSLGTVQGRTRAAAVKAAVAAIRRRLDTLNLYAEVIIRHRETGHSVFTESDAPTVEMLIEADGKARMQFITGYVDTLNN